MLSKLIFQLVVCTPLWLLKDPLGLSRGCCTESGLQRKQHVQIHYILALLIGCFCLAVGSPEHIFNIRALGLGSLSLCMAVFCTKEECVCSCCVLAEFLFELGVRFCYDSSGNSFSLGLFFCCLLQHFLDSLRWRGLRGKVLEVTVSVPVDCP